MDKRQAEYQGDSECEDDSQEVPDEYGGADCAEFFDGAKSGKTYDEGEEDHRQTDDNQYFKKGVEQGGEDEIPEIGDGFGGEAIPAEEPGSYAGSGGQSSGR